MFRRRDRRTFRPKKRHRSRRHRELHRMNKAAADGGDVVEAVRLPEVVDFYNMTNQVYGMVMESCTHESCPKMNGGPDFEYLWLDPPEVPEPVSVSAPRYILHMMDWVERQFADSSLFVEDGEFPRTFKRSAKSIFKRLFRVYSHVYHRHAEELIGTGEDEIFNVCLKHFLLFVREFDLISSNELVPLKEYGSDLIGEEYADVFESRRRRRNKH